MSRDRFLPVTQQATAGDLERFSAAYGTFRWCSCQRWRLRSTPFREAGKEGRVAALAGQVAAGEPVGVLAYDGDEAGEGKGPRGSRSCRQVRRRRIEAPPDGRPTGTPLPSPKIIIPNEPEYVPPVSPRRLEPPPAEE